MPTFHFSRPSIFFPHNHSLDGSPYCVLREAQFSEQNQEILFWPYWEVSFPSLSTVPFTHRRRLGRWMNAVPKSCDAVGCLPRTSQGRFRGSSMQTQSMGKLTCYLSTVLWARHQINPATVEAVDFMSPGFPDDDELKGLLAMSSRESLSGYLIGKATHLLQRRKDLTPSSTRVPARTTSILACSVLDGSMAPRRGSKGSQI